MPKFTQFIVPRSTAVIDRYLDLHEFGIYFILFTGDDFEVNGLRISRK